MPDPTTTTAVVAGGVAVTAGAIAYTYNAALRAYVSPAGGILKQSVVRSNWQRVLEVAKADMDTLTQQLRDGVISLAEWQRAMAQKIKIVHVTSATARGGWLQMSQSDWGYVGSRVKKQYAFLQNFANQVADGTQPLNGNLMRRAQLYAKAGRSTQEALRRRMMGQTGYVDERRHLGIAEHCGCCVEQADKGWQPIGTLLEIGSCDCKVGCQCFFQYRLPSGEEGE